MRKKRILSWIAAGALCVSLLPGAALAAESMDNFKAEREYPVGQFTDVQANSWYAGSVENAYKLGLVEGTSKTTFSPNDPITVASTLALACRLYSTYYDDNASFTGGSPWYQPYVDYALEKKIITSGQFTDYNANATRRQFAAIMAKSLPASALKSINTVEDGGIPDVAPGSASSEDIYTLYRAGILTGSDKAGTFLPETTIDRASVSAILTRMAMPDQRQSITLKKSDVAATGITLSCGEKTVTLKAGETYQINATLTPVNASTKVEWSVSNNVVSVTDDGKITANRGGACLVTATAGSVKAQCSVTVTEVEITRVRFSDSRVEMTEGESRKLNVSLTPSNASPLSLDWTSDTPSVATVSEDGTVTAVGEGSAIITATAPNGQDDYCWVYVTRKVDVKVPVVGREYGPFNLTTYYRDGRVNDTWNITSFVVNSIEARRGSDNYELSINIQGRSTYDSCWFDLYFYDASGRLLGEKTIIESVSANRDFNIIVDTHIECDLLDNAARMEFYSHDGDPANSGGSSSGGNQGGSTGGNEGGSTSSGNQGGSTTEQPSYSYADYYGFDGIPSFDSFSPSSTRHEEKYVTGKIGGFSYYGVQESEINAYLTALVNECGYTEGSQIPTGGSTLVSRIYTRGTQGQSDYREIRFSYMDNIPTMGGGKVVMISFSMVQPTNYY